MLLSLRTTNRFDTSFTCTTRTGEFITAPERQERKGAQVSSELSMATSFAVLIEHSASGSGPAVARTVRSIKRQVGSRATAFVVAAGTSLADALAPVTQDFVLFLEA